MAGMEDAHMRLAQELRELGGCSCSEYGASPPTATEFLREHVGPNRPAVWRGAAAHWPALAGPTAWSLETLVGPWEHMGGVWFRIRRGHSLVHKEKVSTTGGL
jgi:hypothetical protein